MMLSGLKAVITCVDPKKLPQEFIGREYNEAFLEDLPEGVDPCGENGEFHSFVFDAPNFARPIEISLGEVVKRDGFIFVDVVERAVEQA
jgi:diphthamide synthase (EF-2-diphthine--ammonia ligase)